jgi:hypothetical protein
VFEFSRLSVFPGESSKPARSVSSRNVSSRSVSERSVSERSVSERSVSERSVSERSVSEWRAPSVSAAPSSRPGHAPRELPDVTGFLVVVLVTLGLFVVPVGATIMQGPAIVASIFGR